MKSFFEHGSSAPLRPIGVPSLILAGFTLLLSTLGQAVVLFSASSTASRYPYVSATDMIGIAVAFLSTVAGSWLVYMSKPHDSAIRLDAESRSPLLDTFVNEKRPLKIDLDLHTSGVLDTRASQASYLPYFIAGNVCLGIWGALYICELYITSQLALLTNLIIQNYAIFISLHSWRHPELRMNSQTWRTHVLSKGNAALAVLFLWTNSGILECLSSPSIAGMLNNGTIFVLMAVGGGPDPTLGLFLLYDLFALAYGTGAIEEWQIAFQSTALFVVFVLAWDISGLALERRSGEDLRDIEEEGGDISLDAGHPSLSLTSRF